MSASDPLLVAESPEAREARWRHAVLFAARFPRLAEASVKDCERRRPEDQKK